MPPKGQEGDSSASTDSNSNSFFTVPAPIKRLFDKFPLTTYPANELPQRFQPNTANQLFVFTDARGARHGRPSFNPQCLKWQVRGPDARAHAHCESC
jgi:metaxin